jgi:hypothetical protein
MSNSDHSPLRLLAIAAGGAFLGFILGARVRIGNQGAKIIIMPIGRDLVIGLPQTEPPQTEPPQTAEASPDHDPIVEA